MVLVGFIVDIYASGNPLLDLRQIAALTCAKEVLQCVGPRNTRAVWLCGSCAALLQMYADAAPGQTPDPCVMHTQAQEILAGLSSKTHKLFHVGWFDVVLGGPCKLRRAMPLLTHFVEIIESITGIYLRLPHICHSVALTEDAAQPILSQTAGPGTTGEGM